MVQPKKNRFKLATSTEDVRTGIKQTLALWVFGEPSVLKQSLTNAPVTSIWAMLAKNYSAQLFIEFICVCECHKKDSRKRDEIKRGWFWLKSQTRVKKRSTVWSQRLSEQMCADSSDVCDVLSKTLRLELMRLQQLPLWTAGLFLHQWHAPKDCGIPGQASWHGPPVVGCCHGDEAVWCSLQQTPAIAAPVDHNNTPWPAFLARVPPSLEHQNSARLLFPPLLPAVLFSTLLSHLARWACTEIASGVYLYVEKHHRDVTTSVMLSVRHHAPPLIPPPPPPRASQPALWTAVCSFTPLQRSSKVW